MFTIEYATEQDLPSFMNFIALSVPLLPDSDWFVGDSEEFYARHLTEQGFTLKAVTDDGHLAAYFTVRYPGFDEDNCGYDLGFEKSLLSRVAHMETCVVHPSHRGYHLEARLMSAAIDILRQTQYDILLGTVHPDNIPSVKAFLQNGFHVKKTLLKYGGKQRHIMYRSLQPEPRA